jgi:hypothetical protein
LVKKKTDKNDVKIVRSPDHKSHYIIGGVPQWTTEDLRLHLYNEVIEGEMGPYYVSTCQIIMPRSALPRLLEVLRNAARADGKSSKTEILETPPELHKVIEKDLAEKKLKKKVQKIRRK